MGTSTEDKQQNKYNNISNSYKNSYLSSLNKYKINYVNQSQKGGDSHNMWNNIKLIWTDNFPKDKYKKLHAILGHATHIEFINNNNEVQVASATWQKKLEDNIHGGFFGLDQIKLVNKNAWKLHPEPAPVYVMAGKYMNVPDHLHGPIKYASETINVEQLFVPKESNIAFKNTGEKSHALVTGSCASVIISAITVKFVEDMIKKFKGRTEKIEELNEIFKAEYDKRILSYLCGKGVVPEIPWFKPEDVNEERIYNGKFESCKTL
jgi:hypothetical protein